MTLSGADIAQLLSAHGLRPSKALGQNFVADPNTVRRIARLADAGAGSRVLEIGAGLGSLTLALAETGAQVLAVEADRHLVPVLRSVVEPVGVEVLEGDAMQLDLAGLLVARDPGPWHLVSNLPYNVATPLVLNVLTGVPAVEHLLVMVQREVGERMAAIPGDPAYGAVSVRVAYFARAEVAGRVPASVFLPRPRVESVLVRMAHLPAPAVDPALVSYERLDAVLRAGFGQRRKMLRRSLAGVVEPDAFRRAGVRPDARAEELDVAAWGRLAAQ
ncbi:MAG TPA: 16S rRNA (adenine(1518)-N(6)/adenine(1519)-N(6))-dimethyltransferase RsmA [Acidimicrobiales bacterium]|nr:16S rRNA (adenine(1518)-N(6)/adenine(1519)-N(6))-dimethyltransferase RsmA [Acidimicrobiales bacterium]